MAATRQMLSHRAALASVLKSAGLAAPEMKQALTVVERKVESVEGLGSLEARATVDRIELRSEGVHIALSLGALLAPELPSAGANLRMTRVVPMQIKRR